ncbi:flagellar hook-associated protein FlgK [Amphritea sp. HPY]|uniref:flagellar hook-associated protein FlgK n=1 Tax=Amphritea sp. HPY TaxID=3421652 RepID=UPI003D7C7A40
MSSFNLLSIGNQALQANQNALNTVGQNISNVNTPGYSRQVANFVSRENLSGSYINDIERVADDFMTRQVWSDTSNYSYYQKLESFANELDNLLATENTSLSSAMNEYFGALQSAVDDPTSLPNRQLFLAQAGALENRISGLHESLTRQNESINVQLDSTVAQINNIVPYIASLNDQVAKNSASDTVPNEVLDQRDLLIEELSGFIDITTSVGSNGLVDIYIGEGQPLVVGTNSNRLVSIQGSPDPSKNDIALDIGSTPNVITDRIKGGSLGGLLEYRESNLANATNELGRVVMAFTETMNEQHKLGVDLDGDLGGLLFKDINDPELVANRVNGSSSNGGTIQQTKVEITDVSALKASSYSLIFNSSDNFTLIRNQDGQQTNQSAFGAAEASANDVDQDGEYFWDKSSNELIVQVEGFKLTLDGQTAFVGGDSYLIEPVSNGAFDFAVAMTDPRDLALASPLAGSSSINNTGTGSIEINVTDTSATTFSTAAGVMTPAIDISFSTGGSGLEYTITEQGTGTVITPATAYVAGAAIMLNGYEVTISNSPAAGDTFSVNFNTNGVSDNRNALAMSDLQFAKVVEGASYQGVYAKLVEQVGSETKVAQSNTLASQAVLNVSIDQRASVSGVNLDEEATKLIQYQQAYSASAKLISVSQTIFDTLLQSV